MTKFRGTSIALFLTIAALALGACGDDEGSNDSATTGADAAQTTGTTDTGTTETGTTTRERTGKTETRERTGDDEGGSKNGSNNSGSGSSGSGGGGKDSSPEKELTGKNVFSTSKTVCNSFLPTQLAKDLENGKKSAEDIASDYARGYPSAERKQARDGCLAGLKAKG